MSAVVTDEGSNLLRLFKQLEDKFYIEDFEEETDKENEQEEEGDEEDEGEGEKACTNSCEIQHSNHI
jgi:hypothetical protein